jgi:hypothetical protein
MVRGKKQEREGEGTLRGEASSRRGAREGRGRRERFRDGVGGGRGEGLR